jgi:hypothetical protein
LSEKIGEEGMEMKHLERGMKMKLEGLKKMKH